MLIVNYVFLDLGRSGLQSLVETVLVEESNGSSSVETTWRQPPSKFL